MKIIINTTNLRKGGALQVALSLIEELKNIDDNEYFVFLSPAFDDLVSTVGLPKNIQIYRFDFPSRFILLDKVISSLNNLEAEINPDCVFTVFGPTYWIPKSKHVMGFANGIHLYKDLPYLKNLNKLQKLKWFVLGYYHAWLLTRKTDIFIVETEDMKCRLAKFIHVDEDNIKVVANTHHTIFCHLVNDLNILPPKRDIDEFWFITVSAYYPHKNIEVIKKVIPLLNNKRYKFIVTLPNEVFSNIFQGYEDQVMNVGPITIAECPYFYSKADALFLPTLVESFTASYPEAMRMYKPILTSNYSFAKTICQDAALYFDPYDPYEIADRIVSVSTDKQLYQELVENGVKRLNKFPTALQRAQAYIKYCIDTIS